MRKRRRNSIAPRLQPIEERCSPCVREIVVGTATLSTEDTPGTLSHTIHDPLTTIALHVHPLEGARQQRTLGFQHELTGPLTEINNALGSLGEHLAQVWGAAETLFHERYETLHALTLHADLLEDAFQRPTEDSSLQIAPSLAAIKIKTMHMQRLLDPNLKDQGMTSTLQGGDHERVAW